MQSLNLINYVKIYKNIIPLNLCTDTVLELQSDKIWTQHSWTKYVNNVETRVNLNNDKELSTTHGFENSNNSKQIMNLLYEVLKTYFTEINIFESRNWNGYTNVKYNRYEEGQSIKKHVDRITSMFDGERKGVPTLSIVGCLNNDYKGGEFIMFDDTFLDLSAGDIVVFPSTFLYPHQVAEVTKGTRYSFVSWVW
jgi:predicted 2-oxoglutarate/Fe(II)-dependent dioxygenase YbiX